MLPQDPIILFSYINTMLRDRDASLDAFCEHEHADKADICARMAALGYEYSAGQNRFV